MESPDRDFSETERVALLKEIIRTFLANETQSEHTLADIVHTLEIQPAWEDVILPPGRSLGQCRTAFHDIMSSPRFQRPYRPYPGGPGPPSVSLPPPIPPQPSEWGSSQRPIRPRPTPTAISLARSPASSSFSPNTSESRPKRGRPNRTESERRAKARQEALDRGEKDPYPSRSRKKPKLDPTATATSQVASSSTTARYSHGPATTSSMVPPAGSVAFTSAPEAYSYSRALPPLQSATYVASPGANYPRTTYEYPSTRSSRSYPHPETSLYRPPSTSSHPPAPPPPPPPPPPTSGPSTQTQKPGADDNGNHQQVSPPSAEKMEQ